VSALFEDDNLRRFDRSRHGGGALLFEWIGAGDPLTT
jgi:hypothetical protein